MLGYESLVHTASGVSDISSAKKKNARCQRYKKTSSLDKDEITTASCKRNHAIAPPLANTFYVGTTNGAECIKAALEQIGWTGLHKLEPRGAKLIWVDNWRHLSLVDFKEGQLLVNRVPKSGMMTNKLSLLTNLQRYERVRLSCSVRNQLSLWLYEFVPETYRLDDRIDRKAFLEAFKEGDIWICKPAAMNRGKGIYLVRDLKELRENLAARDERKRQTNTWHVSDDRVIQRYIAKPLLLHWRKFDIRAYMLVASMSPYLVLYHEGYARLCLLEYDTRETSLMAHLTNQCVQKQSCAYTSGKENTVWSMDRLNDYINRQVARHKNLEHDWVFNSLTRRMKQIMLQCFQSVRNHFVSKVGFFELFGFDFLIDSDMNVWLIEVNQNPSMSTNCRVLQDIVPEVITNTLYVAIECFEKNCRHAPLLPLDTDTNFHLLFHDSTSFDRFCVIPSATFRDVSVARSSNLLEHTLLANLPSLTSNVADCPQLQKTDVPAVSASCGLNEADKESSSRHESLVSGRHHPVWPETKGDVGGKYRGMHMQYRASEGWSMTMTYNSDRSRITRSMPLEKDGTPLASRVKVIEKLYRQPSHQKPRSFRVLRRKSVDQQAVAPVISRPEGDSVTKGRAEWNTSESVKPKDCEAPCAMTCREAPCMTTSCSGADVGQQTVQRQVEIRDAISGESLPVARWPRTGSELQDFRQRLLGGPAVGSGSFTGSVERKPNSIPRLHCPVSSMDAREHLRKIPLAPSRRHVFEKVNLSTTEFNGVYLAQMSKVRGGFPVRNNSKPPRRRLRPDSVDELEAEAAHSPRRWQPQL